MSHNDISYSKGVEQDPDHRYKFRITDALKLWKTGEYSQSKGIMLKAKNDETMSVLSKTFASYNRSELRPSLTVTYTVNEYYHAPFGWFDAVSSTAISGWVWCFDAPNESLDVRIELENLDSTYAYSDYTVANIQRNDVAAAGYETGRYGFKYYINWNNHPAGEYRVKTYVKDYTADFYYLIDQSPRFYLNDNNLISTPNGVNYLHYGDSLQLSNTVDTTKFSIDWESSDGNLAIVDNNGLVVSHTKQTGDLSKKTGVVNITVVLTSNTTGSTHRRTFKLHVYDETGLSETEYYIMNSNSSKNLSLSYGSTSEGTNVITGIRSTLTSCQWKLDFLTNQKCTLTSVASSDGYKLNANGNNANLSGDSNQYTKQLTIYRYEDAASQYEGTFLVRYGKYYLTQASDNNAYWSSILLNTSYWSFMPVTKNNADMYTIASPNTSDQAQSVTSAFSSLGYSKHTPINSQYNIHCADAETVYENLQDDTDVFFFVGHGKEDDYLAYATFQLQGLNEETLGYISASHYITEMENVENCYFLDDLPENCFSNVRCVILISCKIGKTYVGGQAGYQNEMNINIVDKFYELGAHYVVGTTERIFYDNESNTDAKNFIIGFTEALNDGENIGTCVDAGRENASNSTYTFPLYEKGDRYQFLD